MLSSYRRRQTRGGAVTPYARAGHLSTRMGGAVETYKRITSAAAELAAGLKARGIYPKSTLQRKIGGSRVGRKIPAMRSRTAPAESGGYSQVASSSIVTGRKPRNTLARLVKEVHSKNETTLLRYSGMNNFNDNGYFWCGKNILTASTRTDLPLYMFDLTSVNNTGTGGVSLAGDPFSRAYVNSTGVIGWTRVSGLAANGTTTVANWQNEKIPSSATSLYTPHEKSRLLWTDVRLNLWGAKNKAIKYTVQVVKLYDETLDPMYTVDTTTGNGMDKHNAFWQSLIKPYTYNPLALTSGLRGSKGIKVLKTYETVIQPTSSTESDVDPHVKVLKWFMRWDRDFNYNETSTKIGSATDLTEQADFSAQSVTNLCYTKPQAKLWLMIRASAYVQQTDATVDNTVSPSFDLCVRANHIMQ